MISCDDEKMEYLDEIEAAIRGKRKPLLHRFFSIENTRSVDKQSCEISVFIFRRTRSVKGPSIHLTVWNNRWMVFEASKLGKSGWEWELELGGRLPNSYPAIFVVDLLVDFNSRIDSSTGLIGAIEDALVHKCLHRGPRLV